MGYLDYKILAKGLVLTFSAGLISVLAITVILCWSDVSEDTLSIVSWAIPFGAVLLGSLLPAKMAGGKGLIYGATTAFLGFIILLAGKIFWFKGTFILSRIILRFSLLLLGGILGGILGIGLSEEK